MGRNAATARAIGLLRAAAGNGAAYLFIRGASGCGKSSLVRAGIFPVLATETAMETWCKASFRPGVEPLVALATALFTSIPGELAVLLGTPAVLGELLTKLPVQATGMIGKTTLMCSLLSLRPEAKAQVHVVPLLVCKLLSCLFSGQVG